MKPNKTLVIATLTPSLVIFLLILTPTLVNAVNTNPSNSTNSTNAFSTYENKDFHFKISYPANWTKQEAGLTGHVVVYFTNGSSSVQFNVAVYTATPNETSYDFIKKMRDNTPSETRFLNASSIKLINNTITAAQVRYYEYPWSQIFNIQGNFKVLETVFIKGNDKYSLLYGTDPPFFDRYLPIAKQIINSFRFIPAD